MAVTNPPGWLQNAGATHTAAQMRSYIGGFIGVASSAGSLIGAGGVNPALGDKLQVTQTGSPSMAVIVKSGIGWVPGSQNGSQGSYGVMNDADLTLSVTTAHATLARIDIVVFTVRDSQYSGSDNDSILQVVAGTPAGSPAPPSNPANSIRLAEVLVGAGVTSITNANITDKRTWLAGPTGALPPNRQAFTSSGTWTKPVGARFVLVSCWGGGGAGGGAAATAAAQASCGGGGQAGGFAETWFDATTLAATESVTIGAGGTGGTGVGGSGGNTTFSSSGNLVQGGGGVGGGIAGASANFAITDQTSLTQTNTGQTVGRGAPGVSGIRSGPDAIGGGGVGGSTAIGGGGGAGLQNAAGGAASANTGGGGGGAANNASQSARNGGTGGSGYCLVLTFL